MEGLLLRVIKSAALFLLMFFSLKYLGIAKGAAIMVSSIPLVLGMLNVMTGPAYSIAAIVFILAAFSALLPPKYLNAVDFVEKMFSELDRASNRTTTDKENPKQDEPAAKGKK